MLAILFDIVYNNIRLKNNLINQVKKREVTNMSKAFNSIFKFFISAYFIVPVLWFGSVALMIYVTTPSSSDAYFIYQTR